jgi:signal transduction histidine kinase
MDEVFTNGYTEAEATVITRNGNRIPYYFTGQLIQYEGKPCLIGTGIDITERKKAEDELEQSYKSIRQLTEHLQNIREEERIHIAREIHDELGQQLTVMKMDVSWLNKKMISGDEYVKQKLKGLNEMLEGTVKTVRRISSELRPSLLDDLGLVAAMEWQLKEFKQRSGIVTSLITPEAEQQLPDTVKTGLFRIFQESLTNVARHAHAKKVKVSLQYKDRKIVLTVQDDGKGFDKKKTADKRTLGILGMKERTLMMGGEYEITSTPGKGTTVLVAIPEKY